MSKGTSISRVSSSSKRVFIPGHSGLGDLVICSGIYRHFASSKFEVAIPVFRDYQHSLNRLLFEFPNITTIPLSRRFYGLEVLELERDYLDYLKPRGIKENIRDVIDKYDKHGLGNLDAKSGDKK
jgi:hypothetical protein